jgi:predicted ATPase
VRDDPGVGELEFRVLGGLEVRRGETVVAVPGRKERALLTLLLLNADSVLSAERLIDLLWGERPPRTAANALQVYVRRLRKLLGEGRYGILVSEAGGYRLRLERGQLDASRFEQLAEGGRRALAEERLGEAARRLREALGFWRGPPLAEFSLEEWAQPEIARLEELRLATFEDAVEAELRLGRNGSLAAELEEEAGDNPLRERLHGQLMVALYRAGRQAEALEVYSRLRSVLRDELGLEPSAELKALQSAILKQDPALDAPAPAPAAHVAPVPPTRLLGRARELATAARLLRDENARLLTLVGPGGIGKTRLALELDHLLAPDFADGAAFVSLGSVLDPKLVAPTVVQALGLKQTVGSPEALLEEHLRRLELLLVLDNFEQVLAAAPLLSRLLGASPGLRLVVTSRASLRIAGECELLVPPLTTASAVELFVERARTAKPDFTVTDTVRAELEELCARLDRLPLTIELAAARAKLLTPHELLQRLAGRLDLLVAGRRDAPDRQQTLRATLDWSYGLLTEPEQRLFTRLAVFAGGWSLEAAEAVCADPELTVLDGLAALVDESLVVPEPQAQLRFSMLETVREYALERLHASGEEPELGRRHAAFFLELAEGAEKELHGPRQAEWLEGLEREHDNLRAADGFWRESGDGGSRLRLAVALRRFWQVHGHFTEGRRVIEEALAGEPDIDSLLRFRARNAAGLLAGEQGDLEAAREDFESALALARGLDDPAELGATLLNLGNLAFLSGSPEEARQLYLESLGIAEQLGESRREAVARENLGLLELVLDNTTRAVTLLDEAVAAARRSGDEHVLAAALRSLGAALLEEGELDQAREQLGESLEMAQRLSDANTLAQGLETAAGLAAYSGEADRAAMLFGAADSAREAVGASRLPDQQPLYERWLAATLERLETVAYTERYEAGRALSPADGCALALGDRFARAWAN